jgi:hypothetical protein
MLAEYSIVKCGMAVSLPIAVRGVRRNGSRPNVGAIIGLDYVALAGPGRTMKAEKGCGEIINMLNGSDQIPLFLIALQTRKY